MVTVSLLLCVTGASATFLPPSSSRREEWQKRGLNVVSITKHIKSSESNERRRLRFSKRADGGEEFSNGAPLDGIYLGQIELGTPGQNFTLQFATGSADLWVYGPDANTTKHPKFATSASSTFVGSATPWEITYSDGTTTTGFVAQDTLGIAGFTIPSQGFSVANITSEQLDSEVEDGLIGLGFSTLASNKQTTFMEHLIAGHGGTLNSPVFSLFLERDITFQNFNSSSATDSTGGEICVGCMDESRYKGNVTFVDVASDIFWAVDCQGLTANGKTISRTNMRILVDSGSSIVNLPANIIQAYAEGIGASIQNQGGGNYVLVMSCGALATLGFGFNIGGNIYDVAPLDLFVGTTQGGQCGIILAATNAVDSNNIPLGVVGDAFMKNWYTVFSYNSTANHQLGFARAVQQNSGSLNGSGLPGTNGTDGTNVAGASGGAPNVIALGVIVGSAVGGVAALSILIILASCLYCYRKGSKSPLSKRSNRESIFSPTGVPNNDMPSTIYHTSNVSDSYQKKAHEPAFQPFTMGQVNTLQVTDMTNRHQLSVTPVFQNPSQQYREVYGGNPYPSRYPEICSATT